MFKVYQGVTKGDPLTPKTFNIVVDAVIQHWVILATGEEAGHEGFGRSFKMPPYAIIHIQWNTCIPMSRLASGVPEIPDRTLLTNRIVDEYGKESGHDI